MKKYDRPTIATLLLSLCLMFLSACQDSKKNDYPANYVGFEELKLEHRYNTENQEEILEVKIIAIEKEKTDRIVKLSGTGVTIPGLTPYFQLTETQVTIKADKKSATTRIKIFPNHVIKNANIRLTCTPQWKAEDAKQSQLSIRLLPK